MIEWIANGAEGILSLEKPLKQSHEQFVSMCDYPFVSINHNPE